jgi:3-hydroxymyristoyl/3-hydroxydecanoyl-(acyl carrier protein) dehydratase
MAKTIELQSAVLQRMVRENTDFKSPERQHDVFLDREGCLEFAVGKIGDVLGSEFASIDRHPTRVRLPDEPLMLVDRIISLQGEKRSLTRGRIVTEHDVHAGRWYLDHGVAPPSIAIESGQADLFLSAWLGADFHTKGRAVYRLLDAAVTFHRELPRIGETVRYDIRIKEFFRQGETLLFRFEFDGTIDGQPLLTMRDGCAGFFTPEELAAGQGVVKTAMQLRPMTGKAPPHWQPPMTEPESYSAEQLDAFRHGLPRQDQLRLIHRIAQFDPRGGRFGLGLIRGEADIHPDDWFLTCHFVDDQVMPGTLMYECCLHTLRIAMLRFGFAGDAGRTTYQPVIGVTSRLKCRGQVTAATKTVAYEVSIKEVNDGPEPFAIADALMYADGKPIVDVQDMTLRLAGGALRSEDSASRLNKVLFTRDRILEFARGSPSQAFGHEYAPFDRNRFIARLPAPPYSFVDRIVSATVEPWLMKAGGSAVAEYDVPADAWYFARQSHMPYAVFLEVALQACGWVSAYVGSALQSDVDLHYRNLGGRGTVMQNVGPNAGTLTTTVHLTKVSKSAGMIIQHFDFAVRDAHGRDVYVGDTYFGFFTSAALSDQVGLREAKLFAPVELGVQFPFPVDSPFPDDMLRMIDRIDCWLPNGGPHELGFIRGSKDVDPAEWFFHAHFHQDPVWPGSLGLEAFLQLLQVAAARKWGISSKRESPSVGVEHRWTYRGQVLPSDRRVTVQAEITRIDNTAHALLADGWLLVDDRVIYQMKDFAFRHTT